MAWKVAYRSSFYKNYKKLPNQIQKLILDIADKIQAGENGDLLKYNWADFYAWHFSRKPEYRLVYARYKCLIKNDKTIKCKFEDIEHSEVELKSCNGLIEFVLIDTRENFNKLYKMSKQVS
jgi:mRNA-degrading endonuclease RelE of RelBE toxin-antitoxin system